MFSVFYFFILLFFFFFPVSKFSTNCHLSHHTPALRFIISWSVWLRILVPKSSQWTSWNLHSKWSLDPCFNGILAWIPVKIHNPVCLYYNIIIGPVENLHWNKPWSRLLDIQNNQYDEKKQVLISRISPPTIDLSLKRYLMENS